MPALAEIVCVDPTRVHQIWPHIEHHITAAVERGEDGDGGTYEEIKSGVLDGSSLLWLAWCDPVIEAVCVTQLVRSERAFSCLVSACGGSVPHRWIGLLAEIEKYAAQEGCDRMRIEGRQGWKKLLPDYRVSRVILEKKIDQ